MPDTINNAPTDRENLEWLVYHCLLQEEPCISHSKARHILGFTYMDDLRAWMINYKPTYSRMEF